MKEFARNIADKSRHGRCPAESAMQLISCIDKSNHARLLQSYPALGDLSEMTSADSIALSAVGVADQLLRNGIITFESSPERFNLASGKELNKMLS